MNTKITPQLLMRLHIDARQGLVLIEPLASACITFDIGTPRLVAIHGRRRFPINADVVRFVGQPCALANRVYANPLGNGDEAAGDVWRDHGPGLIQITERVNCAVLGAACAHPYVDMPAVVAEPVDTSLNAAWSWSAAVCSAMADFGDSAACTRVIDAPAMLAAAERAVCVDECVRALT